MRVTPKISDSPALTKKRLDAAASPLSAWNATASKVMGASRPSTSPVRSRQPPTSNGGGEKRIVDCSANPHSKRLARQRSAPSLRGAQLLHVVVRRQHRGAIDIFEIHHDGLAVLLSELADIGSHGGLMVAAAEDERTEGAVDREAVERRRDFRGVSR